jgi:hypothetical protein
VYSLHTGNLAGYLRRPTLNPSRIPAYEVTYGDTIFINFTQHGTHPQGRKLSSEIVNFPAHGTVKLHWEEVLRGYNNIDTDSFLTGVHYTPTGGYTGPDSLTFRVLDIWRNLVSPELGTVNIIVKPAAAAPCSVISCRAGGLCDAQKCGGPASGGCPASPVVGSNACICDAAQGFRPGPVIDASVARFYQPVQRCEWNIVLPQMLVANAKDAGRLVRVPFSVIGSGALPLCVKKPVIQLIRVDPNRMSSCPTGLSTRVLSAVSSSSVKAASEVCANGASMFHWRMLPEQPAGVVGCYKATVLTTDQQTHKVVLRLR